MVLVGNLKDLRLANIIQINCIEQNVAKVTIKVINQTGVMYFSNGRIVHAEFNPYIGERAVYEMLAIEDGKFKVEANIQPPANTITRSWNSVVLEGLRLMDEKRHELTPIPKQLFAQLSSQTGVNNVFVLDYHGRLIEGKISKRLHPMQITFLWYKGKKIVNLFYKNFFRYLFLKDTAGYVFIFEVKPNLVVIETDPFVIVPEFNESIQRILKNISSD